MTRSFQGKIRNTLTKAQEQRVVEQMSGITHFEGCWANGPMHHGCAVARIERLEAAIRACLAAKSPAPPQVLKLRELFPTSAPGAKFS